MAKSRLVLVLTEHVLSVVVVLQRHHVGELVIFVHQVQPLWDHRVVLEAVLPDGEHHFNHVLHSFIDGRLVEHISQTLEDS